METQYKGKLQAHYEQPQHSIVAQVFRGLAGKKVVTPSKEFVRYAPLFSTHHSCSALLHYLYMRIRIFD